MRSALYYAGFMITLGSLATPVMATATGVPEIDGASITTGLALLAGGLLMLRGRLRGR